MPVFKDETGNKYGLLEVIRRAPPTSGAAHWVCRCSCGEERTHSGTNLRQGRVNSCGCAGKRPTGKVERLVVGPPPQDTRKPTRGGTGHPLYQTWTSMWKRCINPTARDYDLYGGRGIRICERWEDFWNFVFDMGERPKGCTLERLDGDGPYAPENCRWATPSEQLRNTKVNKLFTFQGETRCLTDWAQQLGIKKTTLFQRLQRGWDVERAFTTPTQRKNSR